MKDLSLITTIDSNGVAKLTMSRPDVRNAFDETMIHRICDEIARLSSDDGVRILILTGAGSVFSAGADLNMMKRAAGYSASENKDDARRLAHMLSAIHGSNKPTIARVNGPAMGGGVGLVAACDIAITVDSSFFALSEVRVGLIPAVISPFVLQAIGAREARRYFLTGERFDAAKARHIGLVHDTVPDGDLDNAVDKICDALLAGGPEAITAAKHLIYAVQGQPIDNKVIDETAKRIASTRASAEGREGITSFLEKRRPSWTMED